MICKNCGRALAEIPALGYIRGVTVIAHEDTGLTVCASYAELADNLRDDEASYFDLPRAEPA